jgi:hypothetical protein
MSGFSPHDHAVESLLADATDVALIATRLDDSGRRLRAAAAGAGWSGAPARAGGDALDAALGRLDAAAADLHALGATIRRAAWAETVGR